MNISSEIPPRVYTALSEKIRQNVCTPAGAEALAIDIESITGIHLGVNTVKRFVGVIQSVWPPNKRTLDAIAAYLDYPDYKTMNDGRLYYSSRYSPRGDIMIDMEKFNLGATIEIKWTPNSRIVLFHKEKGMFEVKESKNCMLESGDILTLTQLAKGYLFIAENVCRGEENLGMYSASEDTRIKEMNIINIDREYQTAFCAPSAARKRRRDDKIIALDIKNKLSE